MHEKTTDNAKQILSTILDFLQSFIIASVVYILIYHYVAQPQRVVSVSMQPNYYEGDRLIVEKLSYRLTQPKRGDVIVFKYPDNENIFLIKRIVGLPGETIRLQDNEVFINGIQLIEPYLQEEQSTFPGSEIKEGVDYTIPDGRYVVFGDNRARSGDSRIWGTIKKELITGQAVFRYWPPHDIGLIPDPRTAFAQ